MSLMMLFEDTFRLQSTPDLQRTLAKTNEKISAASAEADNYGKRIRSAEDGTAALRRKLSNAAKRKARSIVERDAVLRVLAERGAAAAA